MAVLPRLIALPGSVGATDAQRAVWKQHLDALPPIPIKTAQTPYGTFRLNFHRFDRF